MRLASPTRPLGWASVQDWWWRYTRAFTATSPMSDQGSHPVGAPEMA
jgi:hypothetical protein